MQRHRFDAVSFVFGAVFVALALVALTDVVYLRLADLRWIAPGLLVLLGLVLVLTSGRGRNGRAGAIESEDGQEEVTPAPAAPPQRPSVSSPSAEGGEDAPAERPD